MLFIFYWISDGERHAPIGPGDHVCILRMRQDVEQLDGKIFPHRYFPRLFPTPAASCRAGEDVSEDGTTAGERPCGSTSPTPQRHRRGQVALLSC